VRACLSLVWPAEAETAEAVARRHFTALSQCSRNIVLALLRAGQGS
jgi:hypothetical protein